MNRLLSWIGTPSTIAGETAASELAKDGAAAVEPAASGAGVVTGVQGNTRLTSATGMVLLVMLAVEGVTLLSVRQMITLHVFVGVMLLGPVLLKSGATLYRFIRYYSGSAPYREKGPPHPLLRVLGPVVIVSSLALLGTGVALIFIKPQNSDWLLTIHQTCFWVWVVVMTVHVVGHIWEAMTISFAELRRALAGAAARRRRWRLSIIVTALVLGVGAAVILLPSAGPWTNEPIGHHTQHQGPKP